MSHYLAGSVGHGAKFLFRTHATTIQNLTIETIYSNGKSVSSGRATRPEAKART